MIEKAERYLETLARSKNTVKTYRWALDYFFDSVGEILNDESYELFLQSIVNLSPSTKRIMKSAIMGFYEHYQIGDFANRERINKHYFNKTRIKPVQFERDDVEKILAYCAGLRDGLIELRDRAFVLTLADSGFRISELCSLNRGDIDWREARVMIVGKGGKTAVVRLSKRSLEALNDYLKARTQMDGDSGKPLGSLPLFIQHGNIHKIKRITAGGMRKSVKDRMREAGAKVRIHDFRHYFVTMVMIASNGNLKLAQELARHESTQTTQRYAHFSDSELDRNYDEIFNKR